MSNNSLRGRSFQTRPLRLKSFGVMQEVLPYVFTSPPNEENGTLSKLVFIPNPSVEAVEDNFAVSRVSEEYFFSAVELLSRSIGHDKWVGRQTARAWNNEIDLPPLLAHSVHLNQVDKFGIPYVEHPSNVAQNAEVGLAGGLGELSNNEINAGVGAAWLHDVIEDSRKFFYRELSLDDLTGWGINERTAQIVHLMTRTSGVSDEIYYRKLLTDSVARVVKLADIAHNLTVHRIKILDPETREKLDKKYAKALKTLGYHAEVDTWFKPLIDGPDLKNRAYLSEHSREAIATAEFGKSLPGRFTTSQSLDSLGSFSGTAKRVQELEDISGIEDFEIVLGLFWQFYLLEFPYNCHYNLGLVAEFYRRKSLYRETKTELLEIYPLNQLTIPEIIQRARRAKQNLMDSHEGIRESAQNRYADNPEEPSFLKNLDRDSAAELLLIGFCEFEDPSARRVKLPEFKSLVSLCLERLNSTT